MPAMPHTVRTTRPARYAVLLAASALLASGCGVDEPNPGAVAAAGDTILTGTLLARQWACEGDTAQTASDRMSMLVGGDGPQISSETLDASVVAMSELTGTMLDGTPVTDHSGEKLDTTEPVTDEGVSEDCAGAGDIFGFSDLRDGTQIGVTDGAGKTLGLTELTGGRITVHGTIWDFTAQVPPSDFYEISVSARGSIKVAATAADEPISLLLR